MLVLSRKPGEKLYIGTDITVTVVQLQGNRVRIGIDAPDQFAILRAELVDSEDEPVDCFESEDDATEASLVEAF
jgi:carbon storage regulator